MMTLEENNDLKFCLFTLRKTLGLGQNFVILQTSC